MAYRTFRYFNQSHGSYLGKFEIDLTKAECEGAARSIEWLPPDEAEKLRREVERLEKVRDAYVSAKQRDRDKIAALEKELAAAKAEAELAELRAKAKPGEVEMVMLRNIKPTETFRFKADGSDPICIVMGSGAYYTGYIQAGKPGVNWVDGSTMVRPVAKETS